MLYYRSLSDLRAGSSWDPMKLFGRLTPVLAESGEYRDLVRVELVPDGLPPPTYKKKLLAIEKRRKRHEELVYEWFPQRRTPRPDKHQEPRKRFYAAPSCSTGIHTKARLIATNLWVRALLTARCLVCDGLGVLSDPSCLDHETLDWQPEAEIALIPQRVDAVNGLYPWSHGKGTYLKCEHCDGGVVS